MNYLTVYNKAQILKFTRKRVGETKVGECVQLLNSSTVDDELITSTAKFVLIGLPEDIGVRANYGRAGAYTAWQPALINILNLQSNTFFSGKELLILGTINFDDLMSLANTVDTKTEEGIKILRKFCTEIDTRVTTVIKQVVKSGKIPIIIGGGHNNSYGNIKGSAEGLMAAGKIKNASINCINCDAHSDFRALEDRHSGNGFKYAYSEGYLKKYAMIGLHENHNSHAVLEILNKHAETIYYNTFEDIFIREIFNFKSAVTQAIHFIDSDYTGIELDMDAIENIPASSKTPSGISANQARQYVTWCAQHSNAVYLHLTEAAPLLSSLTVNDTTGKLIAYLVSDFIKAYLSKE
ncbi:MAG: arginase family protein [Bacteroidia bacterium]